MPWTCAVEERRQSQGKAEERWRGLMSIPHINTHIPCRCHPLHLCRLRKSWKPGHGGWICKTTTKIRPARWYERSVFFTSNRCRLHAPCSLTHGYLMSTARLSGNLICWPTAVNKTSLQTSALHVGLLWFDLMKHWGCCVLRMLNSQCFTFFFLHVMLRLYQVFMWWWGFQTWSKCAFKYFI